jgi:hypothetical protein
MNPYASCNKKMGNNCLLHRYITIRCKGYKYYGKEGYKAGSSSKLHHEADQKDISVNTLVSHRIRGHIIAF